MFDLNLPTYEFNIRKNKDKMQIFDAWRHRFVALTPEEWVRQHFSRFLVEAKHFPAGRMMHEACVVVNGQKKRCDAVIYDEQMHPLVLLEYKAPNIPITQNVFNQIASYNYALKVHYLMVSNGLMHYCCFVDYEKQTFEFLKEIPFFYDLT